MTVNQVPLPKVSVFIASYNHAHYLPECLDSILAQTYQNFEIVIVDDGSTDGSREILIEYERRFPKKVHCYWHPGNVNKGISATCNLAITKTSGEYLAWIGSDDIWYPDKLEQQVSVLNDHPEIGLVYSQAQLIDASGSELPEIIGVDVTGNTNPLGEMLISCHTPAMTIMVRRNCLDQVGFFEETLVYSDWDLMVRIFAHWKAAFIAKALAKYRIHGKNVSRGIHTRLNLNHILAVLRSLERKSLSIGGAILEPRNQALLDLQLAFHTFYDGNEKDAVMYLRRAFFRDPSLLSDTAFINSWLNQWKPEFDSIHLAHFGFWTIANLPPEVTPEFRGQLAESQKRAPDTKAFFVRRGIQNGRAQDRPVELVDLFNDCSDDISLPKLWKLEVLKEVYPTLLFESYKMRNYAKTRHYWIKSVRLDPSWLKNRGVWLIGLTAFLSSKG